MHQSTLARTIGTSLILTVMLALPAFAQPRGGGDGPRPGMGRQMSEEQREQMRERMEERMEQMRQRMEQRLQQQLEMPDQEFQAVLPMIQQVQQYEIERQRASAPGWRRGGDDDGPRGRRGGRMGPAMGAGMMMGGPGAGELSEPAQQLQDATQSLQQTVENEDASPEAVSNQLQQVRQARQQFDQQIDSAQEELRQVLTPRQEATLVLIGVLD